ncbi:MAG: cytochrome c [Geminicoccaceae bacterium]|nr:cytochrome c [Geminicoccaceae bacterium]
MTKRAPPGSHMVVMAGLVGALLPATLAAAEMVERGRIIAETFCAQCHATGATGASPLPGAPPFRTFKERWPVEVLAEALAEGLTTGHPEMPTVTMTPGEIDAFLGYLDSF